MEYTINYRNIIRSYNNFDCHVGPRLWMPVTRSVVCYLNSCRAFVIKICKEHIYNIWLCFALARTEKCFEFNLRAFTGKNKRSNMSAVNHLHT